MEAQRGGHGRASMDASGFGRNPALRSGTAGGGAVCPENGIELVLDLDHTLVHAAEQHAHTSVPGTDSDGVHTFYLHGAAGQPNKYKLRMRDGLI